MNKMRRIVKRLKKKSFRKTQYLKIISVFLAFNILLETLAPLQLFALSGGPSQPEVQGFEPIGTSEMVDPFSGDFTYNIPLMDIDGYPINISYHSGITMDQEASWVGLGWNINPGVINRGMRGIPDDFNGEEVVRELNIKDNKTFGFSAGVGSELFGLTEALNLSVDASIGIRYNNYNGLAFERMVGANLGVKPAEGSKINGGLGINCVSSSDNGLSISPSISFGYRLNKNEKNATKLGLNVGCSANSRGGLQYLSYGVNIQKNMQESSKAKAREASYSKGVSSSYDFGMPTYTPQVNMPMHNSAGTAAVTLGGELFGLNGNFNVKYYYSSQKLASNNIKNPAYGYMNSENGQDNPFAMHDFNREKDGSFNVNSVALPVTNYTYDVFSVSGQGVGGSYRPFRSEMGYVYDARGYSESDSWSGGVEVGCGNLFHGGVDIATTEVNTTSGKWENENDAASKLKFRSTGNYPLYEKCYFKEANEKSVESDPAILAKVGNYKAVRANLSSNGYQMKAEGRFTDGGSEITNISDVNYRQKRDRRNQVLSIITRKELHDNLGLMGETPGLAIMDNSSPSAAKGHHIAEITALNTSGQRYVYGIAAYNSVQEEVTFAVDGVGDIQTGNVQYQPGDNSIQNRRGLDNYYSNTKMPAYAHSYLLTAVLSSDYVDSDGQKGPSDGDIGNYTKFSYTKTTGSYQWRTPSTAAENYASYNEGLRTDSKDNKASYTYGIKELWYLNRIETKNYIAIFTLEDRRDGFGAKGRNGGIGDVPMKLLRKISLYSKRDYIADPNAAIPIKEVHFRYDYDLCQQINNNNGLPCPPIDHATNLGGKLTLKEIFFTYGKSNKARFSSYKFSYEGGNPYAPKMVDRWGNYKPGDQLTAGDATTAPLSNAEFPYSEQDSAIANTNSRAWLLTKIELPSGGVINVDYESDDYSYVQNKQAMQMYKICGIKDDQGVTQYSDDLTPVQLKNGNIAFRFKLAKDENNQWILANSGRYHKGIDYLYFRCLMKMRRLPGADAYEYVSGYGKISPNGVTDDSPGYGLIILTNVKLKDSGEADYSPIIKASTQFGRLNLSNKIFHTDEYGDNYDNASSQNTSAMKDLIVAILRSSFIQNMSDFIQGPNKALYYNKSPLGLDEETGVGSKMVLNKSWIRLNNVNGHKYGGGTRVKRIFIDDSWADMSPNDGNSMSYGQEYSYNNLDGTSSGVASYEPQLGGDENPWRTPVFEADNWEAVLAPDDDHYVETPFGECFFPSPSVGYSRVTIRNVYKDGTIKNNRSGSVVHEFYTAKDFPTIVERTGIETKRKKSEGFSLSSLFHQDVKDYCAASQGYMIELNDMHGKPKRQQVFKDGSVTPISSVEYKYQSVPYNTASRLENTVSVINKNGDVVQNTIGVFSDFVSDMREETSYTHSGGVNLNVDGFIIPPIPSPIPIPVPLPSSSSERTQFRSVVVTKVIQRFGILQETIAKDLGSSVATKNLAYDAETGEVLVTQTTTNFNDNVYSITFPAYWHYDGMGAAYKNIGYNNSNVSFSNGYANIAGATDNFAEGDEISITKEGDVKKAWVDNVLLGRIHAIDMYGSSVADISNALLKVMRSGRRNQQSAPMATITMLSNPLTGIKSNFYDKVLQASSIEYSNTWKTFCNCFNHGRADGMSTNNPFIMGTKGMYKPNRSYLHLSERTQANYNNNTNIRKDGFFTSFSPYYKLSSGEWIIDPRNWTFTSEVTEFSPFGAELENRDALGHYSAAVFGYNQSLATAVAANSRYKEVGVDNFEDYDFSRCADKHFKFNEVQPVVIVNTTSHTGRKSIRVSQGTPIKMSKQLVETCGCDSSGVVSRNTNFINYTVTGGTAPYQFSWTSNNNEIDISTGADGRSIVIERVANSSYEVNVKIIDRKGCTHHKKFTIDNGVVTVVPE